MEHVHAIVEDTENEAEAINNNLDDINKELGYDYNISVRGN
jgi:endonuclease IV